MQTCDFTNYSAFMPYNCHAYCFSLLVLGMISCATSIMQVLSIIDLDFSVWLRWLVGITLAVWNTQSQKF